MGWNIYLMDVKFLVYWRGSNTKKCSKSSKFKRKGNVSFNEINMAETTYYPMQLYKSFLITIHLPQMDLLMASRKSLTLELANSRNLRLKKYVQGLSART